MIVGNIEAYITCIDPRKLPRDFAGSKWSRSFIDQLPQTVDPCGENGEFHTVVVNGPMFQYPLEIDIGETVERGGFVFTDIRLK